MQSERIKREKNGLKAGLKKNLRMRMHGMRSGGACRKRRELKRKKYKKCCGTAKILKNTCIYRIWMLYCHSMALRDSCAYLLCVKLLTPQAGNRKCLCFPRRKRISKPGDSESNGRREM